MAGSERLICATEDLIERGPGVRFQVRLPGGPQEAFLVRFGGTARGFLNRCAHLPVELDWQPRQFFDHEGLYLMCATHGATYLPDSGHCVGGPCRGGRLVPVQVRENDGGIYLVE